MKHLDIIVTGLVQGVFYRDETQKKARELGIVGYVKNRADGTVCIAAEGEEDALDELVTWCKKGPPLAKVATVDAKEGVLPGLPTFR